MREGEYRAYLALNKMQQGTLSTMPIPWNNRSLLCTTLAVGRHQCHASAGFATKNLRSVSCDKAFVLVVTQVSVALEELRATQRSPTPRPNLNAATRFITIQFG